MRKMIGAMGAALALFATSAAAQPFDDDGLGWGPYYNNHLSPYNGRPLGPPLSALPPGAEYYNGLPLRPAASWRGDGAGHDGAALLARGGRLWLHRSGLLAFERDENIPGPALRLERSGPPFLQVWCVVAGCQRVAV